jgi:branched-chain amino acid aminotransferase
MGAKILCSICNYFQQIAAKYNCHQALWLFGPDQEITEVGSMNIFAVFKKGNGKLELVTPPLDSGLILPGVTRRSVLELALEFDEFVVSERKITIKDLLNGAKDGTLLEMFGTGTAAIVTPVGNIYYDDIMNPIPIPKADKSFAKRYNHAFAIIS